MEHYSNFWTFEIPSLPNAPGHYLRKYGIFFKAAQILKFEWTTWSPNAGLGI